MPISQKKFFIGCLVVALIAIALVMIPDLANKSNNRRKEEEKQKQEAIMMENAQFLIEDLVVGNGAEAKSGDNVTVHYTGTLTDGSVFDSSVNRGTPFEFKVGVGQVIQGWDQGIPGMKVGGKRKLTIPADMAYGNRALPGIPAGSTLIFEVELLGVN